MRYLLIVVGLVISFIFTNSVQADIVLESKLQDVANYSQLPVEDRCKTVSQEKKMGPALDQGSLGWCYGYAAADLYSFQLRMTQKSKVSPLWMSATYQLTDQDELREAYFNNLVNQKDIAPLLIELDQQTKNREKDSKGKYRNPYQVTMSELLQYSHSSMASRGRTLLSQSSGGLMQTALEIAMSLDKICTTNDLKEFENLKPSTAAWVIEKYSKTIHCNQQSNLEDNAIDLVAIQKATVKRQKDFINSRCSLPSPKNDKNKVVDRYYSSENPMPKRMRKDALYELNESLSNHSIVGISYRAKVITKNDPGQHDYHASTVIGRKLFNNKCFYQIRNTWGSSCDYYKKDKEKVICENGGSIYVEEDELLDHLNGITKFKVNKN